jgi:hypothetical protein
MFGKFNKKNKDVSSQEEKSTKKNNHSNLLEEPTMDGNKSKESSFEKKFESVTTQTKSSSYTDPKKNNLSDSLKDPSAIMASAIGDKSQHLLFEIEQIPDKTIRPIIDFNNNRVFYPILSRIGQASDNRSYLDDLVTDGTLKRQVQEKLIICPDHQDEFSSSVKLYCPRCNSVNVEKLNLYEHRRCGFITENTSFDFSDTKNSECPSCGKKIIDFKKEIRIPAMWQQCIDCTEKFDNAIIKMFCRKHEHDFDINSGHFVTTYSYQLRDHDAPITSDDEKIRDEVISLLNDFNFSAEFKALVKGKSGNHHKIPIYAANNSNGESLVVFMNYDSEISRSKINSILIPILDIGPKHTLLISSLEAKEDVTPLAKQYGIQIISDSDSSKIIEKVDEFISKNYPKIGETNEQ